MSAHKSCTRYDLRVRSDVPRSSFNFRQWLSDKRGSLSYKLLNKALEMSSRSMALTCAKDWHYQLPEIGMRKIIFWKHPETFTIVDTYIFTPVTNVSYTVAKIYFLHHEVSCKLALKVRNLSIHWQSASTVWSLNVVSKIWTRMLKYV